MRIKAVVLTLLSTCTLSVQAFDIIPFQNMLFFTSIFTWFAAVMSEPDRPNIVLFLADDLGRGEVQTAICTEQNGGVEQTPEIYRYSQYASEFERFYTDSPICGPSRYALFTGIPTGSQKSRVRGNPGGNIDHTLMSNGETTFVQALQQIGYATAMFGKWGFQEPPSQAGFDYFLGYYSTQDAHRYFPRYLSEEGKGRLTKRSFPKNKRLSGSDPERPCHRAGAKCTYAPDVLINETMTWLSSQLGRDKPPFFLYFATAMPHDGYHDKGWYNVMYAPSYRGAGDDVSSKPWPDRAKAHASVVSNYLDFHFGILLKEVMSIPNTLFVFLSDNGPSNTLDPARIRNILKMSGPFLGGKGTVLEGGIRSPNLFIWPGVIGKQKRVNFAGKFSDIGPTLLAAAQIPIPLQMKGKDLLPVLKGGNGTNHPFLYSEICYSDTGTIGEHSNCDAQITFGKNLTIKAVFTKIPIPDLNALSCTLTKRCALTSDSYARAEDLPNPILFDLEDDPGERHPMQDSELKQKAKELLFNYRGKQ